MTRTFVFFNNIEMDGECPYCGAPWYASGRQQEGMNDNEPIVCPKCQRPTGDKMRCADIPHVEIRKA